MNKYVRLHIIWAVMIFVTGTSFAQITTTKPSERVESATPNKYDSTMNYLGKDVKQYAGQELYLNGKNKKLQVFGYERFSKIPNAEILGDASKIYNCWQAKANITQTIRRW